MSSLVQLKFTPFTRFLVTAIGLYILWSLIRYGVISPYFSLDEHIGELILFQAAKVASWSNFEFSLYPFGHHQFLDTIVLKNTNGIRIDESCDGVQSMMVFLIFIVAFPGGCKWLFGFLGLWITHGLNALRITLLMFIQYYAPSQFDLHHEYTLKFTLYGVIVLMWVVYAKYFGRFEQN